MAGKTITAGKAKRKELMLFYKVPGGSPSYEIIGKDIEEAGISPSASVEPKRNILGETSVTLDSYEKTTDLDPIYVEGGNKFSEWLDEIEEKEMILDDVKGTFLTVKTYKTDGAGKYVAWEQDAIVELTKFGGNTKGVSAPCTLHWCGPRTFGAFDPATKTFTPDGTGE